MDFGIGDVIIQGAWHFATGGMAAVVFEIIGAPTTFLLCLLLLRRMDF
jgi:hypothetical protein